MKYRIREPLLMVYIIHTNGSFTLYTLNIESTVLNCESRTPKLHTHGISSLATNNGILIPYTWNIELFPFVLNCKSGTSTKECIHVETFHLWYIHLHSWYNEPLIIVQWTPSFVKNEDVQFSIMKFEIRVLWLTFDSVRGL